MCRSSCSSGDTRRFVDRIVAGALDRGCRWRVQTTAVCRLVGILRDGKHPVAGHCGLEDMLNGALAGRQGITSLYFVEEAVLTIQYAVSLLEFC